MAFSQFPFPLAQFPHRSLGVSVVWCLFLQSLQEAILAVLELWQLEQNNTVVARSIYVAVMEPGVMEPGEETLAWDPSSYSLSQLQKRFGDAKLHTGSTSN